jgi:ATP-dependent helicase/nuclease subunit A
MRLMRNSGLKHQRIIANAGSGKTYRLTTRYIELLERQVPAERIVALTFTRKAAGEFLDAIFERLAEASASASAARTLAADTGMDGLSATGCLAHLRQLIDKLPLLTLGTLDSFFGRILRAFPFECGLAGEVAILDDHWQGVVRRQLLADVFRLEGRNEEGFAEFLELIRKQGRNREGRNISGALDREIEDSHERFLLTPADKPWGDPSAIWPEKRPDFGQGDLLRLAEEFEREFFELHAKMDEKHRADWQSRFREMRALHAGLAAPERLVRFAAQAICLPPGSGHFRLRGRRGKAFDFPGALRSRVMALGRAIIRDELEGRLARSRALYELLARFETRYQSQVRDAGQLTFLDVAGLLAAASGTTWGAKSLRPFTRQELNFRLDSSYDHWLLDEFQDTSRLQWQALRDLADEVIQSDSGQRSFFYVGDTKQAIYAWRGGDPRLFDEITDFYNASGTQRIDTGEALDVSFRSVPEILEAVNTVFSPENLQRVADTLELPDEVLDRWGSAWRDHEPHDTSRGNGCFEWRTLEVDAEVSKEALDEETARVIAQIDPLAKGLSCGVLVRTNARILTVINALRKRGIAAASEGKFFASQDSDLTSAVLALLSFVAHPDDSLSAGHVGLTPLTKLPGKDAHAFRGVALARIREAGFHGVLTDWLEKLEIDDKPFARNRAEEVLKVAVVFDTTRKGRASIDDFVAFARGYVSLEDPAARAIRVLTIHAAKGLDFDMVVLPDIDTTWSAGRSDAPLHLHCGPDGRVIWGMDLPQKEICMCDPVLRQAWESDAAEQSYEDLCLSYVAMTRARQGLYLLSRRLSAATRSRDFNRLLHETFSRDGKALGNLAWHRETQRRASLIEDEPITPLACEPQGDFSPVLPSRASAKAVNAASLLGEASVLAAGSEVHRALAKISWMDDGLPDFGDLPASADRSIRAFLKTKTAMRVFKKPATPHSLWRERAFDVMIDGQWISGAFDRVVVYLGDAGEPVRAAIYDFKTGEGDIAGAYQDQMNLYRRSLSCLIGLPEDKISSTLIAVGTGDEIPVVRHPLIQGVFHFDELQGDPASL